MCKKSLLIAWMMLIVSLSPLIAEDACCDDCHVEHPYTAQELVELAIEQHPKLWEAWKIAQVAYYEWKIAQSVYYPQLDFNETFAYSIRSGDSSGGMNGVGNGVFNGINNGALSANSITTAALTPTPITSPLTQGQLPIAAPPLVITPSSVPTPAPLALAASLQSPVEAQDSHKASVLPVQHAYAFFKADKARTPLADDTYELKRVHPTSNVPVTANTLTQAGTQHTGTAITQLAASYLLFDFGIREGNFIAARENFFVASFLGQQSLQDIIFNTLEAYYQYINAQAQHETAALNFKDTMTTYTAAQAQLSAGVVARTDLLQFQAQMSAAQLALEQTKGQEAIALALLMRMVGLPPQTQLCIAKPSAQAWEDSAIPQVEALINLALSWRSDLAAAYANYKVTVGAWKAAQAEGWPVLNARANWMHTSIFQRSRNSSGQNLVAAVTLNVPLYRGGYYTARAQRARALTEAAYANYIDAVDQTMLNVVAAYHQFYTATGSLTATRNYLEYAQASYDAMLQAYRQGAASAVNVVTTQSTLASARAQRITAQLGWMSAVVNVAYTTGTLQELPSVCH